MGEREQHLFRKAVVSWGKERKGGRGGGGRMGSRVGRSLLAYFPHAGTEERKERGKKKGTALLFT